MRTNRTITDPQVRSALAAVIRSERKTVRRMHTDKRGFCPADRRLMIHSAKLMLLHGAWLVYFHQRHN